MEENKNGMENNKKVEETKDINKGNTKKATNTKKNVATKNTGKKLESKEHATTKAKPATKLTAKKGATKQIKVEGKPESTKQVKVESKPELAKQAKVESKSETAKKVENKTGTAKIEKTESKTAQATKVKQVKVDSNSASKGFVKVGNKKKQKEGRLGIALLIILLILIALFVINTYRKYSILTSLNNRYNQYVGRDNYHKVAIYEGEEGISRIDVYRKGNTVKNVVQTNNGKITQITSTTAGTKVFYDTPTGKVMNFENNKKDIWLAIGDMDFISDQKLINSLITPISSEKVDNVDCYVLSTKNAKNWLYKGENTKSFKVYIEKETGLVKQIVEEYEIKEISTTNTIKYINEYNSVTDKDLSAPSDIGEYIIRNN